MSEIAYIEPYIELSNNRIDAHYRNAVAICEKFDYDLLQCEAHFYTEKKYDIIILGNGGSRYSPHKAIRRFIDNNKNAKKIIISNEYNTVPTLGGFSLKDSHLVKGYKDIRKGAKSQITINVNVLTANSKNKMTEKRHDVIYYGTYRPNRLQYFKEYIKAPLYLSTSAKNAKKIIRNKSMPNLINKLNWTKGKETLNLFKYSLYIEDVFTHTSFCNLADRYYEAQSCNAVSFFDKSCKNTVSESEISNVFDDYFFVSTFNELQSKIQESDYENLNNIQSEWYSLSLQQKEIEYEKLKKYIES